MKKLKKSELEPKSKLGIDKEFRICWNCMFWDKKTGRCPWVPDKINNTSYSFFPYNHNCPSKRLFRYNLEYKMYIDENYELIKN